MAHQMKIDSTCKTIIVPARRNILLKLEYKGTNFAGWQIQASDRTVQGVLKEILEKFLRHPIKITGAGRTDAGVHALSQFANFETTTLLTARDIQYKLNCLIPQDIAVVSCKEVSAMFDSRRDASYRVYRYHICERISAIDRDISWPIARKMNLSLLQEMAEMITKGRRFDNFCKTKSLKENNDCLIYESRWSRSAGLLRYDIKANRFLHNMVRLLVGTMIAVNDDLMTIEHFDKLLKHRINEKTKYIAPASGLFLMEVGYERGTQ
jgi:tRNA pseudouridine38-40 synthase